MNLASRSLLLAALVAALLPATARADEGFLWRDTRQSFLGATWEIGYPVSSQRAAFVSGVSLAGFQVDWRLGVAKRLSVGVAAGWNLFSQKYAGDQEARVNYASLRLTTHYYLTGTVVQPYVGVGVGGVYRDAGWTGTDSQVGFGFCVDPQVGLLWTVDQGFALNFLVRYQFTTASFDVGGDPAWRVNLPSWVAGQVGFGFY